MRFLLLLPILCAVICSCSSNEEQILEEAKAIKTKSIDSSNGIKHFTVNYKSKTFICGILWETIPYNYSSAGTGQERVNTQPNSGWWSEQLFSTFDRCNFINNYTIAVYIKANYSLETYSYVGDIGKKHPNSTYYEKMTITGEYNIITETFTGETHYHGEGRWLPEE